MIQQDYIKYLYEKEEVSINEISAIVGIDWRTAAKYAKKDDWNPVQTKHKRRRPVMEPYAETVDVWILVPYDFKTTIKNKLFFKHLLKPACRHG